MKFKEVAEFEIEVKAQHLNHIKVPPQAFAHMWTLNSAFRRISNPELIIGSKEIWQDSIGAEEITIEDDEVIIDARHLKQIDPETKQINELSPKDLMNTDVNQLIVGRAIIKLHAKGLNPNFHSTLAIVITPKGEKFCFGETVDVCSNFTVLDCDYFIDTINKGTQKKKYTITEALQYLKENIFPKTREKFNADIDEIESLKNVKIHKDEFYSFMGQQLQKIEYANYARNQRFISQLHEDEKSLAINSRQLAKIAIEAKNPSHPEYQWEGNYTNLWNIINFGTEVLKPEYGNDIATLLECNYRWIELVKSHQFSSAQALYLPN